MTYLDKKPAGFLTEAHDQLICLPPMLQLELGVMRPTRSNERKKYPYKKAPVSYEAFVRAFHRMAACMEESPAFDKDATAKELADNGVFLRWVIDSIMSAAYSNDVSSIAAIDGTGVEAWVARTKTELLAMSNDPNAACATTARTPSSATPSTRSSAEHRTTPRASSDSRYAPATNRKPTRAQRSSSGSPTAERSPTSQQTVATPPVPPSTNACSPRASTCTST